MNKQTTHTQNKKITKTNPVLSNIFDWPESVKLFLNIRPNAVTTETCYKPCFLHLLLDEETVAAMCNVRIMQVCIEREHLHFFVFMFFLLASLEKYFSKGIKVWKVLKGYY